MNATEHGVTLGRNKNIRAQFWSPLEGGSPAAGGAGGACPKADEQTAQGHTPPGPSGRPPQGGTHAGSGRQECLPHAKDGGTAP
jgi:hypothetical protein